MLAVLVATIRVVGRCLGFSIYVCLGCCTLNHCGRSTTITTSQTEKRELENYRKFSLKLSEVGYWFKGSHKKCKIGPLAGIQWSHNECTIGPHADKISAGYDPYRHVATWRILCMGLSRFQHCVSPFFAQAHRGLWLTCTLHFKLDIVTRNATETGNK